MSAHALGLSAIRRADVLFPGWLLASLQKLKAGQGNKTWYKVEVGYTSECDSADMSILQTKWTLWTVAMIE